jgi:hypothetical protein
MRLSVPIYPEVDSEGLAFFPPFLEGHGAFVCDQDLALTVTVRIRDLNRRLRQQPRSDPDSDTTTWNRKPRMCAASKKYGPQPTLHILPNTRLFPTLTEGPSKILCYEEFGILVLLKVETFHISSHVAFCISQNYLDVKYNKMQTCNTGRSG